ncbi:MAG: type 2 lanthipeptide synthetase LanM [Acidobacteriota bacterium]
MTFDALAEIAARAMTLDERLELAGPVPVPATADDTGSGPRLDAWARAVAGGRGEAFARRLAWDGLDEAGMAAALARPVAFAGGVLPPWTAIFQAYLSRAVRPDAPLRGDLDPAVVFPELWNPLVFEARERLASRAGGDLERLAAPAVERLESLLLWQASAVAGAAAFEEFSAFREAREVEASVPGTIDPSPAYRRFVAHLRAGGLLSFFRQHAVLARQLAVLSETWVETTRELAARLTADKTHLSECFGAQGRVVEIRPSLSDRHRGGRTVSVLRFENGAAVVYKPRDSGAEAAWNGFLTWLDARAPSLGLRPVGFLPRDGYGYFELIEPGTHEEEGAARDYVRRSGALLCAAWLMGLDDLHVENVIASAEAPVIVDGESALQPEFASGEEAPSGAIGRFAREWRESALRSGLLTTPKVDASGHVSELSGLRGGPAPASGRTRMAFSRPNTDAMQRIVEPSPGTPRANLPTFRGRPLLPDDFPDELERGFGDAYRAAMELRDAIAAPGGPLDAFAGTSTRLVLRPSETYARLLLELSTPGHLREGISRSFAIDSLNRVFRGNERPPALWRLTREERSALELLDIPYFRVAVGARAIPVAGGEPIEGRIARSGLEAVRTRLAAMSEESLADHLAWIRPRLDPRRGSEAREPGFSRSERVRMARAIGEDVRGLFEARASAGGAVGKMGKMGKIGPGLYSGSVGIALFFAGLASLAKDPSFLESARDLCRPLARALDAGEGDAEAGLGDSIGAGDGTGSVVYGLTALASVSSDPEYLRLARLAASRITPQRIAASAISDVEGGAAGAVLGLLALAKLTGDPAPLLSATACGDVLLARAAVAGSGWGWPSSDGTCLAGLAHGAAGISLALARLAEGGAGERFADAARKARRYEESLFDSERENWPVLSPFRGRPPVFMKAWCHGAPGIALARAGMLGRAPDASLSRELERAMSAAVSTGFLSTDHLCCGNAGLAEILLAAGDAAGRDDWRLAAGRRMAALLHAAVSRGRFRLDNEQSDSAPPDDPGFFRGLSGIGYALLRSAAPESLPCVLLFEGAARDSHGLDAARAPMLGFDQSLQSKSWTATSAAGKGVR